MSVTVIYWFVKKFFRAQNDSVSHDKWYHYAVPARWVATFSTVYDFFFPKGIHRSLSGALQGIRFPAPDCIVCVLRTTNATGWLLAGRIYDVLKRFSRHLETKKEQSDVTKLRQNCVISWFETHTWDASQWDSTRFTCPDSVRARLKVESQIGEPVSQCRCRRQSVMSSYTHHKSRDHKKVAPGLDLVTSASMMFRVCTN